MRIVSSCTKIHQTASLVSQTTRILLLLYSTSRFPKKIGYRRGVQTLLSQRLQRSPSTVLTKFSRNCRKWGPWIHLSPQPELDEQYPTATGSFRLGEQSRCRSLPIVHWKSTEKRLFQQKVYAASSLRISSTHSGLVRTQEKTYTCCHSEEGKHLIFHQKNIL